MSLSISNPASFGTPKFAFPGFFLEHWLSTALALGGFVILARMAAASFPSPAVAIRRMGAAKWQRTMRSGYVAVILLGSHAALFKYPGWGRWVATLDPVLPPLSLLVTAALVAMVMFKAAHVVRRRTERALRLSRPVTDFTRTPLPQRAERSPHRRAA